MKFNKGSPFRKCPRCKEKCFIHEKRCHECGLVFERLNYTSNKTAKKNILRGRKNEIIKTSDWPFDAKKLTALLLCGFLGFTGAHNFYLGRYWKGSFVLIGFLLAAVMVILTEVGLYETTVYNIIWNIALLPGASVLFFWVSDFIGIFFEKYTIPVSIDENLYDLKPMVIINESEKKSSKKDKKIVIEKVKTGVKNKSSKKVKADDDLKDKGLRGN